MNVCYEKPVLKIIEIRPEERLASVTCSGKKNGLNYTYTYEDGNRDGILDGWSMFQVDDYRTGKQKSKSFLKGMRLSDLIKEMMDIIGIGHIR